MRKYLLPITVVILVVSTLLIFNNTVRYELAKRMNMISAGSYAFSESYHLPYSEASVIKTIQKFKDKNLLSVEKIEEIQNRIKEYQQKSGYDGNYSKWIAEHLPRRLEDLPAGRQA